jgi:hypothetical protein
LQSQPTAPVGPATKAGYGATLIGIIGFALAMAFPDVPEQELAGIASAIFTVVSFAITQVGRYVQANQLAKQIPYAFAPRVLLQPALDADQNEATEDGPGEDEPASEDELSSLRRQVRELRAEARHRANRDSVDTGRSYDAAADEDPELADRVDPGPDEADGDEALEPHYPGRAGADEPPDAQIAARLKWEQQGDACDLDPKIVQREVDRA